MIRGCGYGPMGTPMRGAVNPVVVYFCSGCGKKIKFSDGEPHNDCPKCGGFLYKEGDND